MKMNITELDNKEVFIFFVTGIIMMTINTYLAIQSKSFISLGFILPVILILVGAVFVTLAFLYCLLLIMSN